MITTDLGSVTAYADAVEQGYTGTRKEFGQVLANFADSATQVATDRTAVEAAKKTVEEMQSDVTQKQETAASNMNAAVEAAGKAKQSASDAETSKQASVQSEHNINNTVAAFDNHVEEKKSEAGTAINKVKDAAVKAVTDQQSTSVQSVKDQTASYIAEKETSAKTEIGNYTSEKIAEINKKVSEANTTLANTITDGTTLKTQLETTISTADTSKKNLDASNTTAGKTKTALDTSNTTATKTKADLDASNTTASEAKTGLDATNKTAADLVVSLGDKITEGTQVKTDIQTTGETAMSNLQAEAAKQQEYIKTSIDDTLSISGKAADAAVTGKKIDSLKEDISTKITKFYASNQGETHITDSDDGKIQDMMLYGKSSQDGTPTPESPVEIKSVVNPTVKVTNEDGSKVQSVTLDNITLNAIPVSSGGNVTINGQQYIADYVDVKRGKLVKKLKSFTISDMKGISTWGVNKNADNITGFYFYIRTSGLPKSNNEVMTSTILRYADGAWGGRNVGCSINWSALDSYVILSVPTNMLEDISSDENACASFVKICENTNAIFFYSMASPIETDLTPEEIEAFKALITNYPVTNISVTSDQLDGYTVFNYPTPFEDEWIKTKKDVDSLKEDFVNLKEYVKGANLPETWEQVVLAIKSKLYKEMYAVGDKFSNIWKDTNNSNKEYDNPLRINHFEDGLELEDGTTVNGMWLQTVYAHLKGVQFSHQQAFYASNEGMTAGIYCIGFDYTWGDKGYVTKGDYWNFTLTKDVPAGGKLAGFYGAPDQPQTNWRVYVYSADGKTVLETVSTINKGQEGTLLGVMTAYGDENLNGIQQMAYGDNRYATSAIRQYLNSDKPKGEWWTAQTKWDIAPDQLSQIDGYLCGMDPELLAVLKPVKVVTYCNTVTATGQKQVKDITYDKVTLISLEQMYIEPQAAGEGEAHEYYKELNGTAKKFQWWQTYEILKTFAVENPTSPQNVRLRSAHRSTAYDTWGVYSSGSVNSYNASGALRPAPLMFIGAAPSDAISAPTDAENTQEDKTQEAVV